MNSGLALPPGIHRKVRFSINCPMQALHYREFVLHRFFIFTTAEEATLRKSNAFLTSYPRIALFAFSLTFGRAC